MSKSTMPSYWLLAPVSSLVVVSLWFTHGPSEDLVDDLKMDVAEVKTESMSNATLLRMSPSLLLAIHGERGMNHFCGGLPLTIELSADRTWVGTSLSFVQIDNINGKRDWVSIRKFVNELGIDASRGHSAATISARNNVPAGELFQLAKLVENLGLDPLFGDPDWTVVDFDQPNKLFGLHSLREFGRSGVAILVESNHALIADPDYIERIRMTGNKRANARRIEASLARFRKRAVDAGFRFDVLTLFYEAWPDEYARYVRHDKRWAHHFQITEISRRFGLSKRIAMFRDSAEAVTEMRDQWRASQRVAGR